MLTLEKCGTELLKLSITNDEGKLTQFHLVEFSWLNVNDQFAFLQPAIEYLNGRRYITQKSEMSQLRLFARELSKLQINALPTNEAAWQNFVVDAFTIWMTRDGRAKVSSRAGVWNAVIRRHLQFLRDVEDLIPLGVIIPGAVDLVDKGPSIAADLVVTDHHTEEESQAEKLILTIDLTRSDAEYLDEIRDNLRHRSAVVQECCIAWWKQIEEHFRYGQQLISKTDLTALNERIATGQYLDYRKGMGRGAATWHFANGRTEDSLGRLLTMLKQHRNFVGKSLHERVRHLPSLSCIRIPEVVPKKLSPLVTITQRLNWMLGNLSPFDYACAAALLTMAHPKFTTEALLRAKLKDKNKKPYLACGDTGLSLRVSKGRANSIKEEALTTQCEALLSLILEMTTDHRTALKTENPIVANFFFLVTNQKNITHLVPSVATSFLSGAKNGNHKNRGWLGAYFPQLAAAGITKGSLSLRKIRATQGVLEWFSTGSADAMARRLGNQTQVSIEHYLPRPLLHAWQTRQIRRFQNIWLLVASANEDYQLHATDFQNLSELNVFMTKMMTLMPNGSSPLADELHKRISLFPDDSQLSAYKHAVLSIPSSKQSLLALYLYKEAAASARISASALRANELQTGLSPNDIISLSDIVMLNCI